MNSITMDELFAMRAAHFRRRDGSRIHTEADALEFIEHLGFVWLINPSDGDLPSLEKANPGPYAHASYGENTLAGAWWWAWKQTLPARKGCYYAKVLRGRGTFISWECFPHFYASFHIDPSSGELSKDESRVLDMIADAPGVMSPELRKAFGPTGKDVSRRLDKALQSLQQSFLITVAGGSLEGWTVHKWACVEDWVPAEHMRRAASLDKETARKELVLRYLRMAVAASIGDIAWVFRYPRPQVRTLLADLESEGRITRTEILDLPGDYWAVME